MTRHKEMVIEIDVDPKDCAKCGEDCTFAHHGMFGGRSHCHLFDVPKFEYRCDDCIDVFGKDGE